jgi:alpha-glucosidase
MDASSGRFIAAGRSIPVESSIRSTPLFVREGQLVPMQPGERTSHVNDLADIELHIVLGAGCTGEAVLDYTADDGLSYAYQRGECSRCTLRARRDGNVLKLQVDNVHTAWKPLRLRVVGYDGAQSAEISTSAGTVTQNLKPYRWLFSGQQLDACIGDPQVI